MSILYFNYVKNKKQTLNYAIRELCLFEDQQKFLLICYISLNKRGSSRCRSLRRSVLHVLMSCVHAQCEKYACQDRKSLMPLHILLPEISLQQALECLSVSCLVAGICGATPRRGIHMALQSEHSLRLSIRFFCGSSQSISQTVNSLRKRMLIIWRQWLSNDPILMK